ncbi:MAG: CoA-binding protein [Miltoncostaeaceae bacterium]
MDAIIPTLLTPGRRITMVGASPRPDRPSHGVMARLMRAGFHVTPVNPQADEVLGVECAPDLPTAAARGPLGLVDIFRRPADVPPVVEEALALGAEGIWLQLGISSAPARAAAEAAGVPYVEDRCIAVELGRLGR